MLAVDELKEQTYLFGVSSIRDGWRDRAPKVARPTQMHKTYPEGSDASRSS